MALLEVLSGKNLVRTLQKGQEEVKQTQRKTVLMVSFQYGAMCVCTYLAVRKSCDEKL